MLIKKYIDVKITLDYNVLTSEYVFGADQGLDIAIGLTAYDDN